MRRSTCRGASAVAALIVAVAGCGSPHSIAGRTPQPASALRDSIGVNTHSTYYDTAYGDWPRVVDALDRLGVRHVRDALFANTGPQWAGWNQRYLQAIDQAAARGIRFDFLAGRPDGVAGTVPHLVALAAGRLRRATESLEGPNEYDQGNRPGWAPALKSYQEALFRAVRAEPRLVGVPVVGPSFAVGGESSVGSLEGMLDIGNIHPYTGGATPSKLSIAQNLEKSYSVAGSRPVYATEAGFHNALRAQSGQPPVSEEVAASYVLRTVLDHFAAGIRRTYLYELIDEKPNPADDNPEEHFGLLRNDFSEKPAFTALRDLIDLLGPPRPPEQLTPLDFQVEGDPVRSLLLQRADGTHELVLWDDASLWNTDVRSAEHPASRNVQVSLPVGSRVTLADPVKGTSLWLRADAPSPLRLQLDSDPLVLLISPAR